MFDIGCKIKIIESSIPKGKVGPRKNSLGYVKKINPVSFNRYLFTYISTADIIFFRYGEDKKYRIEEKQVLIALPIKLAFPSDSYGMNTRSFTNMRAYIKNKYPLKAEDKINKPLQNKAPKLLLKSKPKVTLPLVMAVPCISIEDYSTMPKEQFISWMRAINTARIKKYLNRDLYITKFDARDIKYLKMLCGLFDKELFIENKYKKNLYKKKLEKLAEKQDRSNVLSAFNKYLTLKINWRNKQIESDLDFMKNLKSRDNFITFIIVNILNGVFTPEIIGFLRRIKKYKHIDEVYNILLETQKTLNAFKPYLE